MLGWLTGNPCRLKTYVANRVTEIVEVPPPPIDGIMCALRTIQLIAHRGGYCHLNYSIIISGGVDLHGLHITGSSGLSLNLQRWGRKQSSHGHCHWGLSKKVYSESEEVFKLHQASLNYCLGHSFHSHHHELSQRPETSYLTVKTLVKTSSTHQFQQRTSSSEVPDTPS